jgi:FkbM family methyltransferase
MSDRGFKRRLFRLLGPRRYARIQAEYYFLRLLIALKSPRYADGFFGRDLTAFAGRLRPGDTVLDIGAYLGGTAALFAKALGPKGRIQAFEPYHYGYLLTLIQRLGLSDIIRPVKAALGAEAGSIAPSVPVHQGVPMYSQAGILAVTGGPSATLAGAAVPLLRLDDFLAANNLNAASIAAVKIDVEGSELGVFAGGENFFRDFKGFILCELWFDALPPKGWLHLRSLGYACRYLDRQGNWHEANTEGEIRAIAEGETYGNFWLQKP